MERERTLSSLMDEMKNDKVGASKKEKDANTVVSYLLSPTFM